MKSTASFAKSIALTLSVALSFASSDAVSAAGSMATQSGAASIYRAAQQAEKRLQQSASLRAKKAQWVTVAKKYHRVVLEHPRSGYCDDALYYEAELYLETHRRFKDREALRKAMDAYLLLANGYPSSKWAPKARLARGKLFLERYADRTNASIELRRILAKWPGSSESAEAKRVLDQMRTPERRAVVTSTRSESNKAVLVRNVRHWTGDEYTRIVVDLDRAVRYEQVRLENPDRLYFDFIGTRISESLASRVFFIENGFLQRIRVGQNRPGVVRVVLDLESISEYNIFSLPDPYRLVIDVLGTKKTSNPSLVARVETKRDATDSGEREVSIESREPAPTVPRAAGSRSPTPAPASVAAAERGNDEPAPNEAPPESRAPSRSGTRVAGEASNGNDDDGSREDQAADSRAAETEVASADLRLPPAPTRDGYSLARQLGLVPQRVIIDAGHGGHDPGTMSRGGIKEKDLVLDIARRVKKLLEQDGFEVVTTRDGDVFIPLEERTAIANSKAADLFVSIHANAARSSKARGLETFYLNLATTPDAEEVAARENAVSTRRIGELQSLLQKVINNSRITESRELASHVQNSLAVDLLPSGKDSRNRGVKTAPLYVLLGAQMPSVLVEVAFLSNRQDEQLVRDSEYRQKLARSIAKGIGSYHATMVRTTDAASVGSEP